MNVLFTAYPFSIGMLLLGGVIGMGIALLFFGSVTLGIVCFLAWAGMLRILPIVQWVNRWLQVFFPKDLAAFETNVQESFLVKADASVDTQHPKIYCFHPHGLFSLAMFFHIATPLTEWPVERCKATAISWFWHIPFAQELLEMMNFVPSDYGSMKSVVEEGRENLCVVLGGVREMDRVEEGKLTLVLAKRRGIFKMALETGASLVPVITYGENEMYAPLRHPWLDRIQKWCMNQSFFLPIPTWESVEKWIGLLRKPLREPLMTHIGPAIPVKKVEGRIPSEEDIRTLRNEYCEKLQELYKKTKPANYADSLVFV